MKRFIFIITLFIFCLSGSKIVCQDFCFAEADEVVSIPILMYHSVLSGKTGNYSVTPDMLEEDIKFLQKHGYQSIFVKDIISFCEGDGTLPDKPVLFSFDDGHYNNYHYAYPILKKYNFKANLNVIGAFSQFSTSSGDSDHPEYSYLTWDEIKTLHESGLFEIGNHTYKMHDYSPQFGISKKKGEDEESYKNALSADIKKLEDYLSTKCGITAEVFAYPFGEYNDDGEKILRQMGYKAFLTCNEGINKVKKGDSKVLSHLKRINRTGKLSSKEFFEKYGID